MKNSCSSVSKLLGKYFDQEVNEKEKLLVEGHLQDCSTCRESLKSMEELKALLKFPVEEAVQREDFPWVWQKIEKEIRLQKKLTWWQSLASWFDAFRLFRRRVWIPAAATFVVLLLITAQIIFKRTPSDAGASVVEYLDSPTYNVMVYQSEEPKVTVIWLFEGTEQGATPS
jgi:anti-sigma factor RsiW